MRYTGTGSVLPGVYAEGCSVGYWVHAVATAIIIAVTSHSVAQQGLDVEPARRSFRDTPDTAVAETKPELSPAQKQALDKAIETLTAEAKDLLEFEEETKTRQYFSRPHPALKQFDAVAAEDILGRMNGRFTGKEVEDSYVRWHLMWLYEKKPLENRFNDGRDLVQLQRRVTDPEPFNVPDREEYAYEPRDLWAKYRALMSGPGTPQIVVGYPPFQRIISGQAALSQMSAERQAAYAKAVAQAEINRKLAAEIFPKLKRVDFPKNVEFNKRIRRVRDRLNHVRHIIRIYRGELMYALIKTGNPDMLDRVGDEIEHALKTQPRAAFDITSFIYLAAFDGVLDLYEADDLARFGKSLERVARQYKTYTDYGPPYPRNFADYAFTAVESMQLGDPMSIPDKPTGGSENSR